MNYTAENLVIHPGSPSDSLIVGVDPAKAGWELIHFQARRLAAGQSWTMAAGEYEQALVVLSGTVNICSNRGEWFNVGRRANVFKGVPEALYLPRRSEMQVTAVVDCEFAVAWVAAGSDHPAHLITQDEISVEIRGGDNVTRQINGIILPGFDCERLVVVEVYTPSGNWSSYPPHKHDVHRVDETGKLLEADLEEIYYYKIDKPHGFAYQRVYTDENSPMQKAGNPIDAVLLVRNDDLVLVPEGHHPVVSAPGYTSYYLNVLAGSAQALTATDDPQYTWVKGCYQGQDPRVPIFPVDPARIKR